LFYFLFSSIGTLIEQHLHYQAQLYSLLPTDADAIFTLSPSEFQAATVKKNELFLHGKLYDITHLDYKNNQIIVHAKHDAHEEKIVAQLVEYCKKYPTQHFPNLLKKVIDTFFLIKEKTDLDDFYFFQTIDIQCFIKNKNLFSCFLNLFSPPPEGVVCIYF
jgi:oligoribonuclease (3'-5' exoribonuclease)